MPVYSTSSEFLFCSEWSVEFYHKPSVSMDMICLSFVVNVSNYIFVANVKQLCIHRVNVIYLWSIVLPTFPWIAHHIYIYLISIIILSSDVLTGFCIKFTLVFKQGEDCLLFEIHVFSLECLGPSGLLVLLCAVWQPVVFKKSVLF